jgi:Domain of Unknown Function (DUF1080)
MKLPLSLILGLLLIASASAEEGFKPLFNGRDLAGWDGDPALWRVENGVVIGTCSGPDRPKANSFLIWRVGTVKDFELRAKVRVIGDNNSGIQYRSHALPAVGPWAITGYQCDIHPALVHTGMTYEEKGRGIFGLNGNDVAVDPDGNRWLIAEREPVKVDVSQWNEYTVIARGTHLVHKINGKITSQLFDYDSKGRALEGLLAIQLHAGNSNTVHIRDLHFKSLDDGKLMPFDPSRLPVTSRKIEKPRTSNPQGIGPATPANAAPKTPINPSLL